MTAARHLLVAGVQRCGTTWLHDALAAHPEVAMAQPGRPEPKVFLDEERSARGREWYVATYFAHATDERVLGDKSTSYLEHPAAADRARAVLGDPLVLVSLRDPVRRAVSHWSFSTDSGLETRPLAEALEANLAGPLPWDPARSSVSPYAYLERGRYVDHLVPWLERFGPDLRVELFEELVGDPDRIGAVYSWLGVDDGFRPPATGPVNASGAAGAGSGSGAGSGAGSGGALDPGLEERLRAYFEESDAALADLIGRDLPWRRPLPDSGRGHP
jgi:hypothetical protein